MTQQNSTKILLEVIYKADYCLPCLYMDEAVREVVPQYSEHVEYRRVEFMVGDGKKRFLELSSSLFGEEGVRKHFRVAPVPSLFIDGALVFDAIPPKFELEEAIEEVLMEKGLFNKNTIHLEIFHEGEHWIPCVYMTRVVESVVPAFESLLTWEKVVTKELAGARRYQEFSKLCGKPVPVPSIAINGQLVFETTPDPEQLSDYIDQMIRKLSD